LHSAFCILHSAFCILHFAFLHFHFTFYFLHCILYSVLPYFYLGVHGIVLDLLFIPMENTMTDVTACRRT
jgi:hypothetical protein